MSWNKLTVKRSELTRVGGTFGKGFGTVRAVRLLVNTYKGGQDTEIHIDDARQSGGADRGITGEVEYCFVYVRNDGTYLAKSAPSAISVRYNFEAQGATVRCPADGSRDSQVNEIWLFRRGGGLPAFMRSVVKTGVSGTGAVDITDTLSAAEVLIINIPLEDTNTTPPNGIIGIEGPYYDRTFYLTATHLYPSRRNNPDSCATDQVVTVAGADEAALWVRKALGGLYIGTTKDVYRLSGDGAELPDGTINFTLTGLNIDNPPISQAVAQEGNLLVYFASDGWRAIAGAGSRLLVGETSLLYRGNTRHGVSPANISTGRFRAAIAQGMLTAITPEGGSTTSSAVLHRHRFSLDRWYRHTYSNNFRNVYREPDGTLIASDSAGFVRVLDVGTMDDAASGIPVVMWTKHDDLGHPFSRKDPYDFRALLDTGGANATIGFYLNDSAVLSSSVTANLASFGEVLATLTAMASFRHAQLQITGTFSVFRWASLNLGYNPLPMLFRGQTPPSHFEYPGLKTISALQLRVCTLGAAVSVTPYIDNVAQTAFSVTSVTDEPIDYTHAFTTAPQGSELYLVFAGDVELYSWSPIVTAKRPLGIKAWDSGPMDLGTGEFVWPREVWLKVEATADLSIQLLYDARDFGTITYTISPEERGRASKIRVPLPRGYKGRVPRIIVTSSAAFFPWWIEFVARETRAQLEKPPIRIASGVGGDSPA